MSTSAPVVEATPSLPREALQTTDASAVSTPANWQPGDAVVVPPPQTLVDAEKRLS